MGTPNPGVDDDLPPGVQIGVEVPEKSHLVSACGLGKVAQGALARSIFMNELESFCHPSLHANSKRVTGSLVIHSAPSALRQHIEWGIQSLLGPNAHLTWKMQPMAAGTFRTMISFRNAPTTLSKIATSLRSWHYLRFEVRDESADGGDFYRATPELGMHRAVIDGLGNIMISESQILSAMENSFDDESLRFALEKILGTAWEIELEPYRGVELQEVLPLKAI